MAKTRKKYYTQEEKAVRKEQGEKTRNKRTRLYQFCGLRTFEEALKSKADFCGPEYKVKIVRRGNPRYTRCFDVLVWEEKPQP